MRPAFFTPSVECGGEHGPDGRVRVGPRRRVQGSHQDLLDAAASYSRHAGAPPRARLEKVSDRCGRSGAAAAAQDLRGHEVSQGERSPSKFVPVLMVPDPERNFLSCAKSVENRCHGRIGTYESY